jgi:hypothetical protein
MEAKKAYLNMLYKFQCDDCDYRCSKLSSWKQHISTAKHVNANKMLINANAEYACTYCESKFKHQSSFSRHKKTCIKQEKKDEPKIEKLIDITDKDALIIQLLKQNSELQKSLIEMSKDKTITNNNCNNNITNNKTFNLHFFLNETCKDAMNITDFVSSLKLSLEDLEHTGRQGYIDGISNIILKNLNNLEHYKRPIHCSDAKREVLYIKDNDKWEKECETKPILTKAIKIIANENIKQIKDWKNKNPDCTNSDSKKNNLYLKIVSNSMNGSTEEESTKNINKIINNVAKDTIIQKDY